MIYHFLLFTFSKAKYKFKCYLKNINLFDKDPSSEGLSKKKANASLSCVSVKYQGLFF